MSLPFGILLALVAIGLAVWFAPEDPPHMRGEFFDEANAHGAADPGAIPLHENEA